MESNLKKNIISGVKANSIAHEVDIEKGDALISINGKIIRDVVDYLYQMSDSYLEIEIQKEDGEIWEIEIDKDFDEDLGISFYNPILDEARSCKNKCIFCFVDQLPNDMRESLYFKDDDSRLSFLQGNFVTLTNISDLELDRIIEYNISPINVSIHTTNPGLRTKMLNNKNAGNILERLKLLTSNRINVNGQIVLCPGFNDGQELDNTIKDLYALFPNLNSLAVVPVGITKHRNNLEQLNPFTSESANDVINQIEKWQNYLYDAIGTRFVYAADEFYIMGSRELPSYSNYEGFSQLENGVGLIRKMEWEFLNHLDSIKSNKVMNKSVSIVTGFSASSFIRKLSLIFKNKISTVDIKVFPIINNYFGNTITVAGLVTGRDIIEQLRGKALGEKLIIPSCMLKSEEEVFLDDYTVKDVEDILNIKIDICKVNGKEFIESILK